MNQDKEFSIFSWKRNELLLVLGIVLFTFGISFWQLRTSQAKTRDAQRKADVELVGRSLTAYYEDHGIYPPSDSEGRIISCGRGGLEVCEWGEGSVVDNQEVVYMKQLPIEPFSFKGQKYVYVPSETRGSFKIYVALERKSDPDIRANLTIQCGNGVQCSWYASD